MPLPRFDQYPLVALALLSALLHLRAHYQGPRWQVYLFKPLTTTLLLVAALRTSTALDPGYRLWIGAGLAWSLLGDILLMLPRDRFLAGLGCFLLAHLAYTGGFHAPGAVRAYAALLLPLLAAAGLLLRFLWAGLGGLRVPVAGYSAVIVLMVWSAWSRALIRPGEGAALAAVGAALFMVSDAVLALNRFRHPFPGAQALIMSTYVSAQTLIAVSVGVA